MPAALKTPIFESLSTDHDADWHNAGGGVSDDVVDSDDEHEDVNDVVGVEVGVCDGVGDTLGDGNGGEQVAEAGAVAGAIEDVGGTQLACATSLQRPGCSMPPTQHAQQTDAVTLTAHGAQSKPCAATP